MTTFWILLILFQGAWHAIPDLSQATRDIPVHFDSLAICEAAYKNGEKVFKENDLKVDDHRCVEVPKE